MKLKLTCECGNGVEIVVNEKLMKKYGESKPTIFFEDLKSNFEIHVYCSNEADVTCIECGKSIEFSL